jgi:hypothetical protein
MMGDDEKAQDAIRDGAPMIDPWLDEKMKPDIR